MKILIVAPHFPPKYVGGVEFYTRRLADHLRSGGHQPQVVCVEQIDSKTTRLDVVRDLAPGYPVHRLSFDFAAEEDPFRASFSSTRLEAWTRRLLEDSRPDVVHLHSGYLLGGSVLNAARSAGIPTLVTLHDFWFVCPRITLLHPTGERCTGPESAPKCAWCLATEKRRLRVPERATGGQLGRAVVRALQFPLVASATGWAPAVRAIADRGAVLLGALAHADRVLAPSRFLRDMVVQAGVPAGRITISRYGIDVPAPKPKVPSSRPGLRIGYLGQLAAHKGVGVLIEALRHLPAAPVIIQIFGDPKSHAGYADEVMRSGREDARVTFRGAYRHEQVYDILAELDAIVVPSVWYENSPFVIQEAQAAHVPVVASRLGGMRELVSDEVDGLLFEPGNACDLARQLRRLLDEPGLLQRLQPDGASVRTEDDEMRELAEHYRQLARS